MRELFRLSEDEAALIQFYRTLADDTKAAILSLAMVQSDQYIEQQDNIVSFAKAVILSV